MDGPGWDEGGCAPLVVTGAARTIKAGTHAWADMAIPYWKSPGLGCQTWGLRQEQDANQRGQDSHAALLDQAGQQRAHEACSIIRLTLRLSRRAPRRTPSLKPHNKKKAPTLRLRFAERADTDAAPPSRLGSPTTKRLTDEF